MYVSVLVVVSSKYSSMYVSVTVVISSKYSSMYAVVISSTTYSSTKMSTSSSNVRATRRYSSLVTCGVSVKSDDVVVTVVIPLVVTVVVFVVSDVVAEVVTEVAAVFVLVVGRSCVVVVVTDVDVVPVVLVIEISDVTVVVINSSLPGAFALIDVHEWSTMTHQAIIITATNIAAIMLFVFSCFSVNFNFFFIRQNSLFLFVCIFLFWTFI